MVVVLKVVEERCFGFFIFSFFLWGGHLFRVILASIHPGLDN